MAIAPAAAATGLFPLTTPTIAAGAALELRAEATTSSSGAASTVALTTTFTPPASCAAGHLTMLTAVSYQIWLNEPAPLPGAAETDCYPPEWIDGYSSASGASSSVVPVASPLVCPSGWATQSDDSWSSGYMACCASYVIYDPRERERRVTDKTTSGYTLAPPAKTVDKARPAYGGTCYSDFELGQVATVTVYNESALSTTKEWSATTTPAQAYAHPIDGYALDYTPSASSTAASKTSGSGSGSGSGSSSGDSQDSGAAGQGRRAAGRNALVRDAGIALFVTAFICFLL